MIDRALAHFRESIEVKQAATVLAPQIVAAARLVVRSLAARGQGFESWTSFMAS